MCLPPTGGPAGVSSPVLSVFRARLCPPRGSCRVVGSFLFPCCFSVLPLVGSTSGVSECAVRARFLLSWTCAWARFRALCAASGHLRHSTAPVSLRTAWIHLGSRVSGRRAVACACAFLVAGSFATAGRTAASTCVDSTVLGALLEPSGPPSCTPAAAIRRAPSRVCGLWRRPTPRAQHVPGRRGDLGVEQGDERSVLEFAGDRHCVAGRDAHALARRCRHPPVEPAARCRRQARLPPFCAGRSDQQVAGAGRTAAASGQPCRSAGSRGSLSLQERPAACRDQRFLEQRLDVPRLGGAAAKGGPMTARIAVVDGRGSVHLVDLVGCCLCVRLVPNYANAVRVSATQEVCCPRPHSAKARSVCRLLACTAWLLGGTAGVRLPCGLVSPPYTSPDLVPWVHLNGSVPPTCRSLLAFAIRGASDPCFTAPSRPEPACSLGPGPDGLWPLDPSVVGRIARDNCLYREQKGRSWDLSRKTARCRGHTRARS